MITLIIHKEFYTTILSRIQYKTDIITRTEDKEAIYLGIQAKADTLPFQMTEDELVENLKKMICKDNTFSIISPSVGLIFIKCILVAFDNITYIK